MNKSQLRAFGIACLVMTVVLLFMAWERNSTNAKNVAAMNSMGATGMLFGGGEMTPTMPSSSKYALFFAVLTAIGGVYCLSASSKASE